MTIDHICGCPRRPIWQQRPYYPGWFAFILAVSLVCSPVHADDNPPPDATLEAKFTCSLQPVWNDKRSRADLDGFFYLPDVGPTEYIIGGYGNRNKTLLSSDCVLTLRDPAYLAAPEGWELIWKDKGSGAKLDGSMWRAVPPDETYRCVGHVPQEGYDEPYIPNYRCVHIAFTEEIVTGEMIWSDKGSGADKQVTMLHLPNTRSFVAVGARVEQLQAYDLRVDHSSATGDVVVVQAGGNDTSANEATGAEPAGEEASSEATTESADVEAEAVQSLNTGGVEARPDAADSEAARLRAAAEAALAAYDFDLAADYLARLRALRADSPEVAEEEREPSTAPPAQADSNVSEPGDRTTAQADTGATQSGDDIPVEADTSVSEDAGKPIDTGISEISEEASVTTDASVSQASEDAPPGTDTGISQAGEQASITTDAGAPEASDTPPAQSAADTGDTTADDGPLAQAGSIETTPKPSDVAGTASPQRREPQATETKRQALPPNADRRLNFLARYEADIDTIGSLLERGADPNWQGFSLQTSLHVAAIACQPANLELLLRYGGDPGRQDTDGNTPLHFATGGVFPAMGDLNNCTTAGIRVLLKAGADPNQANAEGNAPLHAVVSDGPFGERVETANINALLEAGADPNLANVEGDGPLHVAFIHRRASLTVAGALIDGGAQLDAANAKGMTPLMLAALHGGSAGSYGDEVVALLLELGVDPNRTNPDGDAPLHILVKKETGGDGLPAAAIADALLAGGADPCMRDADGKVPHEYLNSNSPVADALASAGGSLSPTVQVDTDGNSLQVCLADEEQVVVEEDSGSGEEGTETEELEQQLQESNQYAGEMVAIPGGTFQMGDGSSEEGGITLEWSHELPIHTVTIRPFNLGKYEVTFAQWDACVAGGGCGGYRPDDEGWARANRPVINVSWDDAQLFIDWLNGKTDGGYRLPSEAEWEYAARAGSATDYSWGNDIGRPRANCINAQNYGCDDSYEYTAPVGSLPANAWGLHDMHGNVFEWTQDCTHDDYEGAPNDGSAWTSNCYDNSYNDENGQRVVRGGSWGSRSWGLRSAIRYRETRSDRSNDRGFRLAQDP